VMRRMSWGSSAWRATYSNSVRTGSSSCGDDGDDPDPPHQPVQHDSRRVRWVNVLQADRPHTKAALTRTARRTTHNLGFTQPDAPTARSLGPSRSGPVSFLTHGEALNNDGVNVDGTCVKCSRAGLEMTSMTDPTTQARALGLRKPPLKKAYSPKSTSASQLP
jgi:hypothetical protein